MGITDIIVAMIGGLCVGIPNTIGIITANKKSSAVTDIKLDNLTKKVEEHNKLIDRMYHVESRVTVLEEELKDRK